MKQKTKFIVLCILVCGIVMTFYKFFNDIKSFKNDDEKGKAQEEKNIVEKDSVGDNNFVNKCRTDFSTTQYKKITPESNAFENTKNQEARSDINIEQTKNKLENVRKHKDCCNKNSIDNDQNNEETNTDANYSNYNKKESIVLTDNKTKENNLVSLNSVSNQLNCILKNKPKENLIFKKDKNVKRGNFEVIQDNKKIIFQMKANEQQRADLLLYIYLIYNNITDEEKFSSINFPSKKDSVFYLKIINYLEKSQDLFLSKIKEMGGKRVYTAFNVSINLLFQNDSKKFYKLKRDTQLFDNDFSENKDYPEMSNFLTNFFNAFKQEDFLYVVGKTLRSSIFYSYKKQLIEDLFLSSYEKFKVYQDNLVSLSILDYIIFTIFISL